MRICQYYPLLRHAKSGVTASISAWTAAMIAGGHDVSLVCANGAGDSQSFPTGSDVHILRHVGRSRPTYLPVGLASELLNADVLVIHEGWTASNVIAARVATRKGVPYIVIPHGAYEPAIVAAVRGPVGPRHAVESKVLRHAAMVQIFFDSERPLVSHVSPGANSIAIPTGHTMPAKSWIGGGGYLAWFGRYDPEHKGLDLLLRGLSVIAPQVRPRMRMHGYDYKGGRRAVENLVSAWGLGSHVSVGEPIHGRQKEDFLLYADAYLHLSRWESHSVALVECLGYGVPCIVNADIHIAPLLREYSAALTINPSQESIELSLGVVRDTSAALSANARTFVADYLNWDRCMGLWEREVSAVL